MGVNLKLIDILLTQQSDPTDIFGSVAAATQFTMKEKKAKFNVFFLKRWFTTVWLISIHEWSTYNTRSRDQLR